MGQPITTTEKGVCFAFPSVCLTPTGVGPPAPIPYPNVGQLSDADPVADTVEANGFPVVHAGSKIEDTVGDQAGTDGGVASGATGKKVEFASYSGSVYAEGEKVVRMFDATTQNDGNAVGLVLGGFPTVLVGG